MKLLQNRAFLICLCIALVLTIVPTVWGISGRTDLIRASLNTIAAPFRALGHAVSQSVEGFRSYFSSVKRLQRENESLRAQIDELESRQADYDELEFSNQNLRKYVQIGTSITDYVWVEAHVVGTGEQQLILNKGTEAGFKPDMAVITSGGVLGKIVSCGRGWSFVQPLSSTRSQVSAYVARSGAVGLVQGEISSASTGVCAFLHLQEDADVRTGDVLVTSGYGSIYPEGLLIGVVEKVEYDEVGRAPVATVRMQADPASLSSVLVLTGEAADD